MTRGPTRRDPGSDTDGVRAFEAATGEQVLSAAPLSGGDIGDSFRLELRSGERLFLKVYPGGEAGMARAEARGLDWIAEAEALPVACPRAVGDDWLALDWIESAPPAPDYAERLGTGLARLHASAPESFGLSDANFIGSLPQQNDPASNWAEFYAQSRIIPLRARAARAGHIAPALSRRIDLLLERLPDLVGPPEAPARLHGDLWSGNVIPDALGRPCLIDPAVYGGHREIDLAMMKLFGGFSRGVFDAYQRQAPLAENAERRVDLYQVYPLLVHVCLFGNAYVSGLSRAVESALS